MKQVRPSITPSLPYIILLAATSMTILAYEIVLMRLLSIGLWYHYAYMVISMALLGFGASGSILVLVYDRIKKDLNGWLIILSSMASISFPMAFSLSQKINLDPLQLIWQPFQWVYMMITYGIMSVPFLLAGGMIGIILTCTAEKAPRMYAVDLMGAGCGALLIVPLLYTGPPWKLLPFLGCILLLGTIGACLNMRRPGIGLGIVVISGLILMMGSLWMPPIPRIHETKALPMTMAFPDARIEASRNGPLGMIDVVGSSQIRHVPGLSLNFGLKQEDPDIRLPEQKAIFVDADGLSPITSFIGDMDDLRYLDYTTMALPYHLSAPQKVLIIGAGGGSDILLGLFHQTPEIIGLEANQQIVDLILKPFAVFSGHLYSRHDVRVEVREARQFLHSTNETFDLIQLSLIDSFVNSAGGLHSATEDYLYTVEAFKLYLNHLTDTGVLAVTRWIKLPPRDSLRTLSTALEALRQMETKNPVKHILFIRSWKTFTILISRPPFPSEAITKAKAFCGFRSFDIAYYDGMPEEEANKYDVQEVPYYYNGAKALCGSNKESFLRHYVFDVSSITDNRPFFSHFFRWKKVGFLFRYLHKEWLPMIETGYIFILATLVQAVMMGLLLILMPLLLLKRIQRKSDDINKTLRLTETIGPLIYFGCIGLGFMFFEMVFIPRFTLLLSHPVYAATVVLAAVLISAGVGSFYVKRFSAASSRFLWIPVLAILGWVLFYLGIGDEILDWGLRFSFGVRLVLTILLLLAPAFFLGWLFPSGLRILAQKHPDLIPWAWGVNGCASVIGAVLGKCLAVTLGLHSVVIIASLLYILAVASFHIAYRSSPLNGPESASAV